MIDCEQKKSTKICRILTMVAIKERAKKAKKFCKRIWFGTTKTLM